MAKAHILVVEDEEDILELLRYNLEKEGYGLRLVTSGEEALTAAINAKPDLILLDLMLPGLDGLEVCKEIKANHHTAHIPVIMVTAKGEESDIITGLEIGADDYISKPFSPKVLVARVRTVLRRKSRGGESGDVPISQDGLDINPGRFEVKARGEKVDLTATEFQLLYFLAKRPGWVFTRQQIVDAVKGEDYAVTERAVDVQVVGLRKKLGESANCIETVRGVGYRFRDS